ncbi:MAG: DNA/RNA nuclease SfsA [Spirochaetaceae bacterium]|nr:DNA/RNA nuclease SfsA [Spirochaetaceae bacterium]
MKGTKEAEGANFFWNDREGVFVSRPNRFLVKVRSGDEELSCYCPNPGRLLEFTLPGERFIVQKNPPPPLYRPQRTRWTAVGVYHGDDVVPLYAYVANMIASELVLPSIIPSIRVLWPEFSIGGSRFDFLAEDRRGVVHLVEVKACSLVEHGVAMFPDAPSERALRHLEELAVLAGEGYRCHMLFMIVHGKPKRLVPNLHTDPAFAAALSRHAGRVALHTALIRCDGSGYVKLSRAQVPVDLSHGDLAERNSGNYLLVLELKRTRRLEIGALGSVLFRAGWYVYAGSAAKNLSQRMARHLRRVRKKIHWHIDYLTPHAGELRALPIRSYRNLECRLAGALGDLGGAPVPGFGCSDCACGKGGGSHLYYFEKAPLQDRAFIDTLLRFRHTEALVRKQR